MHDRLKLSKPSGFLEILLISLVINPLIINFYPDVQRYLGYLVMAGYVLYNRDVVVTVWKLFQQKLVVLTIVFLGWGLWSVVIPIAKGTFDFSFIKNFWYGAVGLLYLLTILVYVVRYYSHENVLDRFCELYCYAMALYVLGTLVICIVPVLRDFVVEFLVTSDHDRKLLDFDEYITRIGWSGIAVYGTSLKCSIAFAFAVYLFDKIKTPTRSKYIMGITIALLLLGNLLYARTGIVACLLVGVAYVCKLAKAKHFKTIIRIGYALGAIAVVLGVVLYVFRHNSMMIWMFEGVYNIFNGNGIAGSLSMILEDMLFVPEIGTLLFGDGLYTYEGAYYMHTDLGFMRILLYGGIFFAAYIYLWVSGLLVSIFKCHDDYLQLCINAACVLLIFEIKGEALVHLIPMFAAIMILAGIPHVNNNVSGFKLCLDNKLVRHIITFFNKSGNS